MPFATIANQSIFYRASGPAPADSPLPVLLLLHGAGGSHLDWPSTSRNMPDVPVVVPDLPGHGQSSRPGCASIEKYASFVVAFIDGLGLKRVVVAGHSMGGAIAQMVALQRPVGLKGLILVGTGPMMRVSSQILDQIHDNMPAVADFVTQYAWFKNANFIMKGVGRRRVLENDPDVLYGDYTACNQFDIRARLDQIDVPALVIGGDADRFMPLKFSQMLVEGLPQAELSVIAGAGHMIQLEKPEAVREKMERFVRNCEF